MLAGSGSVFASSLLRSVTGFAQSAPPKRLVIWSTPCGVIEEDFRPTGGERNFVLPRILAPLERVNPRLREKLLMFGPGRAQTALHGVRTERGISVKCNADRPVPSTIGHGCETLLTGIAPTIAGEARSAAGPSIDQWLVQRLNPSTRFRSLQFSVGVSAAGRNAHEWALTWGGAGAPLPVMNDPREAFTRVFSNLMIDDSARRRIARRQSVLDAVHRNFTAVRGTLGAEQRRRLEAHLTALREVEQRVQNTTGAGAMCRPPTLPASIGQVTWDRFDGIPQQVGLQVDLMVAALQCGLTQIASFQYGTAAANLAAPWLGIDEFIHTVSHGEVIQAGQTDRYRSVADPVAAREKFSRYNAWLTEQLARFVDALERTPEGSGTMLDNTLVLVVNELSDGNFHTHQNMPWYLIGNVGEHFSTGRYVTFADKSHNDLLVSVARAFGQDVMSFGAPSACTGPLPGLTR